MTDYWPQEEGAIFDAESYILPCRPDDTISELSSVKVGTTVAGRISVTVSAALGDGIAIALKAATSAGVPTRIPCIFYGVCKVTYGQSGTAVTMGSFVMNSITTTFLTNDCGGFTTSDMKVFGGASYVMGMALQACAAGTDEGIILVGKCM
jgi:hypothetical protein